MKERKKKALIDSDFIIKAVNTKNNSVKLIDFFIETNNYELVCHEKILEEVSEHSDEAKIWLQEKINNGMIRKYSDKDIFDEVSKVYLDLTKFKFLEYIKNSCNYISSTCFENSYHLLNNIDIIDDEEFLKNLKICDDEIGKGKSIGERKSMILLQMLLEFYPFDTYYFCSDDKGARRGIVSITSKVQCFSILSIFNKLNYINIDKETIKKYFDSFIKFINEIDRNQTQFRVFNREGNEIVKVDFNVFIEDLLNNKFISLANGYLQYK